MPIYMKNKNIKSMAKYMGMFSEPEISYNVKTIEFHGILELLTHSGPILFLVHHTFKAQYRNKWLKTGDIASFFSMLVCICLSNQRDVT